MKYIPTKVPPCRIQYIYIVILSEHYIVGSFFEIRRLEIKKSTRYTPKKTGYNSGVKLSDSNFSLIFMVKV